MKKILIVLFVLFSLIAKSQTPAGYTTINSRYDWLAGLFKALSLPAGGTAAFTPGQAQRAGSVYYDSTGGDAGLYVYNGSAWVLSTGGTVLRFGVENEDDIATEDRVFSGDQLYSFEFANLSAFFSNAIDNITYNSNTYFESRGGQFYTASNQNSGSNARSVFASGTRGGFPGLSGLRKAAVVLGTTINSGETLSKYVLLDSNHLKVRVDTFSVFGLRVSSDANDSIIVKTSGGELKTVAQSDITGGGGSGGISEFVSGYGLISINDSTARVDTNLISTRAWRDKLKDSLSVLINSAYDGIRLINANTFAIERPNGTEDTVVIEGAAFVDTIYRVVGTDSIYWTKDGNTYAFLDSTSAGISYTFSTGATEVAGTVTINLSTGVSGGQSAIGGTASGNDLTLSSTSHATKGDIIFGTSRYDEVNNRLGIQAGSNTLAAALDIWNGISGAGIVVGAESGVSTRTNSTNKFGGIAVPSFLSANLPVTLIRGAMGTATNTVVVGGGVSGNSLGAQAIEFFTSATPATTTFNKRVDVTLNSFRVNSDLNNYDFIVSGDVDANTLVVDANALTNGAVGIGNNAPATKLDVTGVISTDGLNLDRTITATGTTGNQTINKVSGTVNIAAAGTTVTVTNSLVDANSIIHCVIRTNDATARIANVVPGSGSFVINIVACTAEISIGFFVTN